MRSVGIDIGQYSVKIAEVEASSKGYSILRTDEFPLSQDPSKDRKIELIDLLRNISHQYDHNDTRFAFALPQTQVSSRQCQFPFKERHKILKSLAFELEDDIPLSFTDAVFDAKIVRYVGNSAEVMASAVPKDKIMEALQLASDSNLEPDLISCCGLATSNLFENCFEAPRQFAPEENPTPEEKPAFAVLDLGHKSSTLLTYKEGRLIDIRTFDFGGLDVAQNMSQKLDMHIVEAIKQMQKKAHILLSKEGASTDQTKLSDSIKETIDEMAQIVELSLIDLKTSHHLDIQGLFLIGGLSRIKNLNAYLTQKLNVKTNMVDGLRNHPQIDFSSPTMNAMACAQAIAIAIEGIKRPKNPATNFMRGDFAKKSQSAAMFWERWSYALKVAAAMAVLLLIHAFIRDDFALSMADEANYVLKEQTKKITGLKGRKANSRNARKYILEQKQVQKNRVLAEQLQTLNSAMDIVKMVSNVAPSKNILNMNVLRFSVNNSDIVMEGEIRGGQGRSQLREALLSLASDGRVQDFTSGIKPRAGYQSFGFKFRVLRKEGGQI
jgi:general secretion pathway protein L